MRRLKRFSKIKNFFFAKIFAKTCVLVVVLNADMQYMYLNFASEYLHEKDRETISICGPDGVVLAKQTGVENLVTLSL